MKHFKFNTLGMTLPEVLVALTVTTGVVIVITNFMVTNLQESTLAEARGKILSQTELSLDLVSDDVRLSANADQNNRWADPNGPSSNQYGWTANSTTLIVATAVENANGNIIFSDPNNYITEKNNLVYFVKNGALYKRTIASPVTGNRLKTSCPAAQASPSCPKDEELLQNVSLFNVTYLDGDNQSVSAPNARSVEIRVKVNRNLYQKDLAADYTTRMVFRND